VITDESLKRKSRPQKTAQTAAAPDNLCELLLTIIKFAHHRQRILAANIRLLDRPDFVPKDLPCRQFSRVLRIALDEYLMTDRLLLADTDKIKFLGQGCFEVKPVLDCRAFRLLRTNKEQYIRFQVRKLVENSLEQRCAAQLLRQSRQYSALCD
jgi:hypothetical protein